MKVQKVRLLKPCKESTMAKVLTGVVPFREDDYSEIYSAPRDAVESVGWGAVTVAEYIVNLSICGYIKPLRTGLVLMIGNDPYMFVSEALQGSSRTLDYRPLPSWSKFGIVPLGIGVV